MSYRLNVIAKQINGTELNRYKKRAECNFKNLGIKEPSPPGTDDELLADVETAVPEDLQEGATPPPDQVLPGPPPQQTEKEQEGQPGHWMSKSYNILGRDN